MVSKKVNFKLRVGLLSLGKNIGKTNETTIVQQTHLEINSLYQKQLDSGYVLNINSYTQEYRPQLAFKYEDKSHKVNWPDCNLPYRMEDLNYASRKLNGIRCFIFIVNGLVTKFESRTGKSFKYFPHIADFFIGYDIRDKSEYHLLNHSIIDGELFNKDIPFEILCSLVNSDEYVEIEDLKTGKIWSTKDVQFHMYDVIDLNHPDENFYDRFIDAGSLIKNEHVKHVQNVIVKSEQEMIELARRWILDGYEGLMLRSGKGSYSFGRRTINLLKYKEMYDQEFLILDILDSENEPGQPRFVIEIDKVKNITCDVRMKGSKEHNKEYLINKNKYINKWLKTQYQEINSYGNLSFPVGLEIREGTVINEIFIPSF